MRTSESIDKIANAFRNAQAEMNAASKVATNPHFKSKYADLSTVIDAVKGPLNEARIAFLQTVTADTTGIMVTTILMHETGQWFEETLYLPVPQQTPQAYGSAITYAKRYSLQSMCGLPSEDDDGERASQPEKENAHRVETRPKSIAEAPGFKKLEEGKDPGRPNTATQVAVDAFEEMSAADQKYLGDLAVTVKDMVEGGDDAHGWIEAQKLSTEQRLGLWSLLPSAVRTSLQRAARGSRAPNLIPPSDLASQP